MHIAVWKKKWILNFLPDTSALPHTVGLSALILQQGWKDGWKSHDALSTEQALVVE